MERHIAVPFSEEELKELHAGDYIYLTGTIYSARDAAHKRMYDAICVEQEKHPEESIAEQSCMRIRFCHWILQEIQSIISDRHRRAGTGHRFCRTYNKQPYG